jgi:peptidylprolyl isomerase
MTMKIGETAELTIPGQHGYGAGGFPAWGIKPNATLVFEIEVLSMK